MAKPKDRTDTFKQKNDITKAFRLPRGLEVAISEKAEKYGMKFSEYNRILLEKDINKKSKIYSGKSCFSCKRTIKNYEMYYSEQATLERYTPGDKGEYGVDVIDCLPFEILCMDCAGNKNKLKQFEGPLVKGDKVRKYSRKW